MAVFAGFINIFKGMEDVLSSLAKVGFSVPGGLLPRIELMRKVRTDLGEPDSQGHFQNPSRDRINDATREVGSILAVLGNSEKYFYRTEIVSLGDRCEALFEDGSELNTRIRALRYQINVSAKYKIDQLPLHAMRKRFAEHVAELRALEVARAEAVARRIMAEIKRPEPKASRSKGSRSAAKREADRQLRAEMKGKTSGGGKNKKKQAA